MRTWTVGGVVLAGLLTAGLGSGRARADDGTEARIQRLEALLREQAEQMDRLRRDLDASRRDGGASRPTAEELQAAVGAYVRSQPDGVLVAPTDHAAPGGIRWGGYFHWRFQDGSEDNSFFDQHRVILQASADITECIDFDMELEIEHGGISDEIEGEVVLEKAEVKFHLSDAFVPKVGWLLVPFGRYNLHHDDPLNDLTNRPFTARYLVPTGFGQPGVGVQGAAPFGCDHVFSYDVAVTNGYRDAFTDDNGVREARQAEDDNDGKQVWGRLAATWNTRGVLDYLETGVSGTWGVYDDADENEVTGYALDVLLRKGPFEAKAEWVAYDYERNASDPPGAVRGQSALWVEGAWHFMPCALQACRTCLVQDTSLFTLVVRWQTMDLDDRVDGASARDDLDALTVGLNYRITERTVIRVDHTWYDAEDGEDTTEWTLSVSTYF